ncbi:MAG TPA: hypothetical protein VM821_05645 [Abditibacteriaceae bacterium]|jgi:predicted Mrr-cat superfamily restriction endonuclease|nr:hypothetical protein [Abditibacteriaceae bacterium]
MNVWKLKTHNIDPDGAWQWSRKHERISIGWGNIGDLRSHSYSSADDIKAAIQLRYPKANNAHAGSRSLWNLFNEMQNEDLVLLSAQKPRVVVVRVLNNYDWNDQVRFINAVNDDYFHQRQVEFTNLDPEKVWRSAGGAPTQGENPYQALVRIGKRA